MSSLLQVHDRWKTEDPSGYLSGKRRSDFLVELVGKHANTDDSILEIGSNCGRNLEALRIAGYTDISGVEINPDAVQLMWNTFPDLVPSRIMVGSVEGYIERIEYVDLIYTMACLEHIHPDSEWVFAEMAARAGKIITIEDEVAEGEWKWPRNYSEIFTRHGMRQSVVVPCSTIEGLGDNFVARVFYNSTTEF